MRKQETLHEASHRCQLVGNRPRITAHVAPCWQGQRAHLHPRTHLAASADEGWTDQQICAAFDVSRNTAIRVRQLYLEGGLEAVLYDKRQARYRQALTGGQAAHLIAIACSPAPTGHDHWTVRLLAGKAVELGFVESISPETIRQLLKKTNSTPGNTSSGASPR